MMVIVEQFFYLVCEAIGTAATPGLFCQPRVIMKMIMEKQMECRLAGETDVLGENLPQRHFCPSQNPILPDPGLNPGRQGGKPLWSNWWNEYWQVKPTRIRRKPAPVPFCPRQIPHYMTRARTRVAAVGSQRLTAEIKGGYHPNALPLCCLFRNNGEFSNSVGITILPFAALLKLSQPFYCWGKQFCLLPVTTDLLNIRHT
jgi:hypothetical protein